MSRLLRTMAVLTVCSLGVAACGDDEAAEPTSPPPVATETPSTEPAGEPVGTDASVPPPTDAVAADGGFTVVAERIVSLSPTHTEMLFAIGAGEQVIAVDDQSNYPAEVAAKPNDLSGFTPNVEAIAAYEPDLVVIGDDFNDLAGQLSAIGIEAWVGPAATSFDDIYVQIEQLGVATGRVGEAAELVAQMQTDIDAAVASAPDLAEPLRYYHELDPTYYSVTSNTFIGQIYGLFGLQNIADTAEGGTDYPQLSPEFIISQDPDLIFLADTKCCDQTPETVAARAGWAEMRAVSSGSVVAMDDDVASRWGPRVVDYIEQVAATVTAVAAVSAG